MVGLEGILVFFVGVIMKIEYDYLYKVSVMFYFSDIKEVCCVVVVMKRFVNVNGEWIVKGVELFDWKFLVLVNDLIGEGLIVVLIEIKVCI